MRDWRLFAIGLSGLAAISCGGDGGNGVGLGITPPCVDYYMALNGMLDGQPVDAQVQNSGSLFQQLQQPYTFDADYAAGGGMHLKWATLVPIDGAPVAVTGTIDMPAGAPHGGETLCAGGGALGEVDTSADAGRTTEFRFTLGMLSSGAACTGAALMGSIKGCIKG
jgi:hypothetical protein